MPSPAVASNEYFAVIYYLTMAFNESFFVLLLLIGYVVNKFVKVRQRRANLGPRSQSSGQLIATRSNSETTMYIK